MFGTNKGEILRLAGCDLLTISPGLLSELQASTDPLIRRLSPEGSVAISPMALNEKSFGYAFKEDATAVEETAEGIRKFADDKVKIEALVRGQLG